MKKHNRGPYMSLEAAARYMRKESLRVKMRHYTQAIFSLLFAFMFVVVLFFSVGRWLAK
jgi:ABC-type transport system involved in cytochrome c biogenesis permease component